MPHFPGFSWKVVLFILIVGVVLHNVLVESSFTLCVSYFIEVNFRIHETHSHWHSDTQFLLLKIFKILLCWKECCGICWKLDSIQVCEWLIVELMDALFLYEVKTSTMKLVKRNCAIYCTLQEPFYRSTNIE